LDTKTIQKVAHLAKLSLAPQEVSMITNKLTMVLEHFEKIAEVPTEGVEPLVTPISLDQILRSDEVCQELSPEEILENAPSRQGNLFKVPPVL
jgi:aspartyl-tRNA(Asn)/glutamyl-tRNA(Gln) amidotransferase subunit C